MHVRIVELYVRPAWSRSGMTNDTQVQLQQFAVMVSFEVSSKHRSNNFQFVAMVSFKISSKHLGPNLSVLSGFFHDPTPFTVTEKQVANPAWNHSNVTEVSVTLSDVMFVGATRSVRKHKTGTNSECNS